MDDVERLADQLLAESSTDLLNLERQWLEEGEPLADNVAMKLARSKAELQEWEGPLFISVVFAMNREHERILTPEEHPLGEDFLNRKVAQLRWLFGGRQLWELVIVDDGCPDGSGAIAERIVKERGYQKFTRVLYIADAIAEGHPIVSELRSADESRKGGSIELGMYEAAQHPRRGHLIVYTDADLSTHLGQLGLLAAAIRDGADTAAGSRREPTSVVVKGQARNDRGRLFIYLWKQLLPELGEIIDTQCGFKAFRGDLVEGLVTSTSEKQFAFDVELLLRSELHRPGSITRVPVAWVDSEAGSTTTELEPYLPMLQAIAHMYRRYLPRSERPEQFADLIERLDEDSWNSLIDNIPSDITEREPFEFAQWQGVGADQVALAAGLA